MVNKYGEALSRRGQIMERTGKLLRDKEHIAAALAEIRQYHLERKGSHVEQSSVPVETAHTGTGTDSAPADLGTRIIPADPGEVDEGEPSMNLTAENISAIFPVREDFDAGTSATAPVNVRLVSEKADPDPRAAPVVSKLIKQDSSSSLSAVSTQPNTARSRLGIDRRTLSPEYVLSSSDSDGDETKRKKLTFVQSTEAAAKPLTEVVKISRQSNKTVTEAILQAPKHLDVIKPSSSSSSLVRPGSAHAGNKPNSNVGKPHAVTKRNNRAPLTSSASSGQINKQSISTLADLRSIMRELMAASAYTPMAQSQEPEDHLLEYPPKERPASTSAVAIHSSAWCEENEPLQPNNDSGIVLNIRSQTPPLVRRLALPPKLAGYANRPVVSILRRTSPLNNDDGDDKKSHNNNNYDDSIAAIGDIVDVKSMQTQPPKNSKVKEVTLVEPAVTAGMTTTAAAATHNQTSKPSLTSHNLLPNSTITHSVDRLNQLTQPAAKDRLLVPASGELPPLSNKVANLSFAAVDSMQEALPNHYPLPSWVSALRVSLTSSLPKATQCPITGTRPLNREMCVARRELTALHPVDFKGPVFEPSSVMRTVLAHGDHSDPSFVIDNGQKSFSRYISLLESHQLEISILLFNRNMQVISSFDHTAFMEGRLPPGISLAPQYFNAHLNDSDYHSKQNPSRNHIKDNRSPSMLVNFVEIDVHNLPENVFAVVPVLFNAKTKEAFAEATSRQSCNGSCAVDIFLKCDTATSAHLFRQQLEENECRGNNNAGPSNNKHHKRDPALAIFDQINKELAYDEKDQYGIIHTMTPPQGFLHAKCDGLEDEYVAWSTTRHRGLAGSNRYSIGGGSKRFKPKPAAVINGMNKKVKGKQAQLFNRRNKDYVSICQGFQKFDESAQSSAMHTMSPSPMYASSPMIGGNTTGRFSPNRSTLSIDTPFGVLNGQCNPSTTYSPPKKGTENSIKELPRKRTVDREEQYAWMNRSWSVNNVTANANEQIHLQNRTVTDPSMFQSTMSIASNYNKVGSIANYGQGLATENSIVENLVVDTQEEYILCHLKSTKCDRDNLTGSFQCKVVKRPIADDSSEGHPNCDPLVSDGFIPFVLFRGSVHANGWQLAVSEHNSMSVPLIRSNPVHLIDDVSLFLLSKNIIPYHIVHVEHCINCDQHQISTRHIPGFYEKSCVDLMRALSDSLPPFVSSINNKVYFKTFTPPLSQPRIGSFELSVRPYLSDISHTVFSKVQKRSFPVVGDVTRELRSLLCPPDHAFDATEPLPVVEVLIFDGYYKRPVGGASVKVFKIRADLTSNSMKKKLRELSMKFNPPDKDNDDDNDGSSGDSDSSIGPENPTSAPVVLCQPVTDRYSLLYPQVRAWGKKDVNAWLGTHGASNAVVSKANALGAVDGPSFARMVSLAAFTDWGVRNRRDLKVLEKGLNKLMGIQGQQPQQVAATTTASNKGSKGPSLKSGVVVKAARNEFKGTKKDVAGLQLVSSGATSHAGYFRCSASNVGSYIFMVDAPQLLEYSSHVFAINRPSRYGFAAIVQPKLQRVLVVIPFVPPDSTEAMQEQIIASTLPSSHNLVIQVTNLSSGVTHSVISTNVTVVDYKPPKGKSASHNPGDDYDSLDQWGRPTSQKGNHGSGYGGSASTKGANKAAESFHIAELLIPCGLYYSHVSGGFFSVSPLLCENTDDKNVDDASLTLLEEESASLMDMRNNVTDKIITKLANNYYKTKHLNTTAVFSMPASSSGYYGKQQGENISSDQPTIQSTYNGLLLYSFSRASKSSRNIMHRLVRNLQKRFRAKHFAGIVRRIQESASLPDVIKLQALGRKIGTQSRFRAIKQATLTIQPVVRGWRYRLANFPEICSRRYRHQALIRVKYLSLAELKALQPLTDHLLEARSEKSEINLMAEEERRMRRLNLRIAESLVAQKVAERQALEIRLQTSLKLEHPPATSFSYGDHLSTAKPAISEGDDIALLIVHDAVPENGIVKHNVVDTEGDHDEHKFRNDNNVDIATMIAAHQAILASSASEDVQRWLMTDEVEDPCRSIGIKEGISDHPSVTVLDQTAMSSLGPPNASPAQSREETITAAEDDGLGDNLVVAIVENRACTTSEATATAIVLTTEDDDIIAAAIAEALIVTSHLVCSPSADLSKVAHNPIENVISKQHVGQLPTVDHLCENSIMLDQRSQHEDLQSDPLLNVHTDAAALIVAVNPTSNIDGSELDSPVSLSDGHQSSQTDVENEPNVTQQRCADANGLDTTAGQDNPVTIDHQSMAVIENFVCVPAVLLDKQLLSATEGVPLELENNANSSGTSLLNTNNDFAAGTQLSPDDSQQPIVDTEYGFNITVGAFIESQSKAIEGDLQIEEQLTTAADGLHVELEHDMNNNINKVNTSGDEVADTQLFSDIQQLSTDAELTNCCLYSSIQVDRQSTVVFGDGEHLQIKRLAESTPYLGNNINALNTSGDDSTAHLVGKSLNDPFEEVSCRLNEPDEPPSHMAESIASCALVEVPHRNPLSLEDAIEGASLPTPIITTAEGEMRDHSVDSSLIAIPVSKSQSQNYLLLAFGSSDSSDANGLLPFTSSSEAMMPIASQNHPLIDGETSPFANLDNANLVSPINIPPYSESGLHGVSQYKNAELPACKQSINDFDAPTSKELNVAAPNSAESEYSIDDNGVVVFSDFHLVARMSSDLSNSSALGPDDAAANTAKGNLETAPLPSEDNTTVAYKPEITSILRQEDNQEGISTNSVSSVKDLLQAKRQRSQQAIDAVNPSIAAAVQNHIHRHFAIVRGIIQFQAGVRGALCRNKIYGQHQEALLKIMRDADAGGNWLDLALGQSPTAALLPSSVVVTHEADDTSDTSGLSANTPHPSFNSNTVLLPVHKDLLVASDAASADVSVGGSASSSYLRKKFQNLFPDSGDSSSPSSSDDDSSTIYDSHL